MTYLLLGSVTTVTLYRNVLTTLIVFEWMVKVKVQILVRVCWFTVDLSFDRAVLFTRHPAACQRKELSCSSSVNCDVWIQIVNVRGKFFNVRCINYAESIIDITIPDAWWVIAFSFHQLGWR